MNPKEKAIKELYKISTLAIQKEHIHFANLTAIETVLDIAIQEAKKEVFDDIENLPSYKQFKGKVLDVVWIEEIDNLKKRHLSTFPKEKQHNSRKNQSAKCKKCNKDITGLWNFQGYCSKCVNEWRAD